MLPYLSSNYTYTLPPGADAEGGDLAAAGGDVGEAGGAEAGEEAAEFALNQEPCRLMSAPTLCKGRKGWATLVLCWRLKLEFVR